MTLSPSKRLTVFLVVVMGVMVSPRFVFGGNKYERESLKAPVRATTWRTADVTYGVVDNAHEDIRKILGDAIDAFINDYLAVNPR